MMKCILNWMELNLLKAKDILSDLDVAEDNKRNEFD